MPTIEVTAAAVAGEPGAPTLALSGPQLLLRQGGGNTLGAALSGLPGLTSTWYGPNADRPVVRGLDGNRVDLLANGSPLLDASAASHDHNAPLNPLAARSIELLRGPQALRYSGGAVGGVVDVIDDAVPSEPLRGIDGAAQIGADSAFRSGSAAFTADGGDGHVGLHADGYVRDAGDYAAPRGAVAPSIVDGRVLNSGARAQGGSLGGGLTGDWGFFGAAISGDAKRYGTVVDPNVQIDMHSTRATVRGALRDVLGADRLGLDYTHTDYHHTEIDGGEPATRFVNRGHSLRLDAERRFGGVRAEVGMQALRFDFSALGDEAFLPQTRTRHTAVYALASGEAGAWAWSAGARAARVQVESAGEAATGIARFGPPQSRRFTPLSVALQGQYALTPQLTLTTTLSHNERAPSFDELYANGPHDATGAYERGNPALPKERSHTLELGIKASAGRARYTATAFYTRYATYITLLRSGQSVDGDGEPVSPDAPGALPEFDSVGVRARFVGVEASALQPLFDHGGRRLDLAARLDWVRADDLRNGQPLPRIAPLHFTPTLVYTQGPWSARAELQMAARQTRVPTNDLLGATPGYVLVNASLTQRFSAAGRSGTWFVKLNNLLDQRAYNATTLDTLRNLAPLPGRGVAAGMQFSL
ncbi:MAG: TonB-dependent receptor [Thiomonas sp.]